VRVLLDAGEQLVLADDVLQLGQLLLVDLFEFYVLQF